MHEGPQVSKTTPPTRTYIYSGAAESEVREGDQVTKLTPPPGRIEKPGRRSAESELHEGNGQIGQNSDGQTHGSGARYGVGWRRKNGLIGGWGNRTIGQNLDGQAHGTGAGCGVGRRRNNR